MFEKSKAKAAVQEIFKLAESAAMLPMKGMPFYDHNARFEFLFLFLFLKDYKEFINFEQKFRKLIVQTFIDNVSKETGMETKVVDLLYEKRIMAYYGMRKATRIAGDFIRPVAEYIAILTLYQHAKGSFAIGEISELEETKKDIDQARIGPLSENIEMSISMNTMGLL